MVDCEVRSIQLMTYSTSPCSQPPQLPSLIPSSHLIVLAWLHGFCDAIPVNLELYIYQVSCNLNPYIHCLIIIIVIQCHKTRFKAATLGKPTLLFLKAVS